MLGFERAEFRWGPHRGLKFWIDAEVNLREKRSRSGSIAAGRRSRRG